MTMLLLGLVLFLGIHPVAIVAPRARDAWVQRLGEMHCKGLYSLVSLVGFALIVWGYGLARQQPVLLHSMPNGFRHLAALLMAPVFVLLFATYLPGRIQAAVKHPMLLAVVGRISVKHRAAAGLLRTLPIGPPRAINDAMTLVGGLAVYALLAFWLHAVLFGVRPFG